LRDKISTADYSRTDSIADCRRFYYAVVLRVNCEERRAAAVYSVDEFGRPATEEFVSTATNTH